MEWDKKRTARTETDGTKTYKPKRDDNGLKTTQIYAKVVDEKKEKAAHAIKLNINNKTIN